MTRLGKGLFNLLKSSRFVFLIRFAGVVFRSRRLVFRGKYDRHQWSETSMDVLRLVEDSGGHFHITGFDNIRDLNEPVVFVSNHMSTLDSMVFPSLIAPFMDATFIVKDNLVDHPFFGPIMRSRNPIVVSRENSRRDLMEVINKGGESLKDNISVVVFPQSTRRTYLKLNEFNSLGVKLASKNRVKVVPMAIKTDYWRNGKVIKDLGQFDREQPIHIAFGKPVDTLPDAREAHKMVLNFIVSRLKSWGVEVVE
ncbi:MAG: 1-acyl-sn-glycerol-3-phosphate acyltransferase [Bacteroidales bacterium]|nr:1-acyl-sn-glycerol-3-phosphate acyltransferase [Bacteroidales bacterium]